jgi:hypothetical protein
MASFHCSVKPGAPSSAGKHSRYISRTGPYASDSKKNALEDLKAAGCANMPSWAKADPTIFWDKSDQHERKNGTTYREAEFALPRELTLEQQIALVEDFIREQIGDRHAYQYGIHCPPAALEGGEQPHVHLMYSERVIDGIDRDPADYFKRYNAKNPERGGCRKDSAGTLERLEATRKLCADIQNKHLAMAGRPERVDHRSLKDQGISRAPEPRVGPRKNEKTQIIKAAVQLSRAELAQAVAVLASQAWAKVVLALVNVTPAEVLALVKPPAAKAISMLDALIKGTHALALAQHDAPAAPAPKVDTSPPLPPPAAAEATAKASLERLIAQANQQEWYEYELDGEPYRRDTPRAEDATRVQWLSDGNGLWHEQPREVVDAHAQPEAAPESFSEPPRGPRQG